MPTTTDLVDRRNREYIALHTAKEDAFWRSYMGLGDDAVADRAALDEREIALQRWLQDPAKLEEVRAARAAAAGEDAIALAGWEATFAAHAIDRADARVLAERVVRAEGELANARGTLELGYDDPGAGFTRASSVKLGTLVRTDKDERVRRAAWNGLRSIEPHVLAHGFVELVRLRNQLGKLLGGEDYYDWKVRRVERMSKAEIFSALGALESLTREGGRRGLDHLARLHGKDLVKPWNISFLFSGDSTREQDPYFSFGSSIARWGASFAALGVRFKGASLTLDLLDRPGKHENGFMHGPAPAWRERGRFHPARINFTANAIPGMVGSGHRATATLFHEGGHAAHFANVDMPAPCFGQEFAPTSVAFAEIQSMFLDSLLSDADWQRRYATDGSGEPMPVALIERSIRAGQPGAALGLRAMLAVCFAEKAIYEIPDDRLSPESITEAIRGAEREILGLEDGAGRPTLSVPHLLSGESSAYYHGYVLADMGVRQTRDFFHTRDGHLLDNPRIGPDLARHYWQPGNGRTLNEMLRGLTGSSLDPAALARDANRTVEEALAEAEARIAHLPQIAPFAGKVELDARVSVVHGREEVARLDGDFTAFAGQFEAWLARRA